MVIHNSNEVIWFNYGHEFWDQTLIKSLLKDLPESERTVVVVPGGINTPEEVNKVTKSFKKVLIILTSDESVTFKTDELSHPDMIVYTSYPRLPDHMRTDRFLPIGTPKMPQIGPEAKKLAWFFAGQINHKGREDLAKVLRNISGGKLIETEGFAQGLTYDEYLKWMNLASIIPCPGGPESPDSFRLYETLELGCIPITDNPEFFNMLFCDIPFPMLSDWSSLPDLINNLKDRPEQNNICMAWWMRVKRQLRWNLEDDLGIKSTGVTVLIPTSPIESHPSTEIIEQTVQSVRERLPDSDIFLLIDGVREEQEDKRANYIEYTRRLLWKAKEWGNVYPMLFETHQHQANMTREALKHVRTPTILFVEHDIPLTGEIPIKKMVEVIENHDVNLIRLHHEAQVLDVHKHLMLDEEPQLIDEVPLLRTAQWSQRPHLASTEFYRHIIETYFPPTGSTMIEDKIYGVIENAWFTRGVSGWNDFRLWMYSPEGDIKRSINLDGRGSEDKYEMRFE